jgi:hypothetical protein
MNCYAKPLHELLDIAPQSGKRGDDEEQILHTRRVVVGLDDLLDRKWPALDM